jgi:hypothetical protein
MPKSVSAHNFPVQLTSFVGRAAQLTEVRKLLADNWLVTPVPVAQQDAHGGAVTPSVR